MNNCCLFIIVYSLNLKMIDNQIGPNGASSIGESLKLNQSLQTLNLGSKIYFLFNFKTISNFNFELLFNIY
jgi:hypothetical protein